MSDDRIKIAGKTYKVPAMDDLTLDDILVLDVELQSRYGSSWVAVQQYVQWSQDKSEAEVATHPMSTLMAGVTVWMVLRLSGKQDVSMQDALKIPPTAIEDVEVAGPKDHLSKQSGKKARKATAKGSGPAVALAPAPTSSPQTTSSDQSESA